MRDFLRLVFTRQNIFKAFWILFIISVIPVGVYLVQKTQIFKSRATVTDSVAFIGGGYVTGSNGQYVSTQLNNIRVKLTSPIVPDIPPVPANLSVSCSTPGTTASFSWTPVEGATRYDFYLHKSTDPWSWDTACDSPHLCQRLTNTSYSAPTTSGESYVWHLAGCNGAGCSPATEKSFICALVPIPNITKLSINTDYQPWAVSVYTTNTSQSTVVQLWEGANQWGGDIAFVKATNFEGGTFQLPATSPPSGCNLGQACSVNVKLYNRDTQALSNSFVLSLPAVPNSSLNMLPEDMRNATVVNGQKVKWFEGKEAMGAFRIRGNSSGGVIIVDEYGPVKDAQGNKDYIKTYQNNSDFTVSSSGNSFAVILRNQTSTQASFSGVSLNKIADITAQIPAPTVTPPPSVMPPSITNGGINTDFQPWVVWLNGANLNPDLKVQFYDQRREWGSEIPIILAADRTWLSVSLPSNTPPSGCNKDSSCEITVRLIGQNRNISNEFTLTLPQSNIQGVAVAAERPYTTHFKVAKSPGELNNAPLQDYDTEPKYIDFTFSNTAPGTAETLYVKFIVIAGGNIIKEETRQASITYQPSVVFTSAPPASGGNPPRDFSNIRSTPFYDFPDEIGKTHKFVDDLKNSLPAIKEAGFNTIWLVVDRGFLNPSTGKYNDNAFKDLREVLSILKQNGLKAIIPLSYGADYYTGKFCPYEEPHYKELLAYQTELLRQIVDYNNIVYISVFTESAWGVCGPLDSKELVDKVRPTLGNFPRQLPVDLRSKFTIGLHDAGLGAGWYGGASPIEEPNPFDFISDGYYVNKEDYGKSDAQIRADIDQKISNIKKHYPNTPIFFGEAGTGYCSPFNETKQAATLSTIVGHMLEKNLGVNVWMWKPLEPVSSDCNFGGHAITKPDGTLRPAGLAVKNLFAGAKTPVISNAGVNTEYNPWAVWAIASNLNSNIVAQVFDQGNRWGGDIPLELGSREDGTFNLPSNSPPSECNRNGSCEIRIKLFDTATGALSNEFPVILPQAPNQAPIGGVLGDLIGELGKLINPPKPLPSDLPAVSNTPTSIPSPILIPSVEPTPIPTPVPGPIQTIVNVITNPLLNILPNLPIVSNLVSTPSPTPVPVPAVTTAAINTSGNPWTVTVSASNVNFDTRVKLFDQGKEWESGILLVLADDRKGGSFVLPSNTPPSGCNQKTSCEIKFQIFDKNTGALSNQFPLTLPINAVSQEVIQSPVVQSTPLPTPQPTPAGSIQTIVKTVTKPLENIIPNIPFLSNLVVIPEATPLPSVTPQIAVAQTDFNGDSKTNAIDLSILFSNWGKELKNSKSDINGDSVVNSVDYTLFLKNYKR